MAESPPKTAPAGDAPPPTPTAEKAPTQRVRVWRACETCRKRKVKCNGQEPCSYCLSSGKICSFKDMGENGGAARPYIPSSSVETRLSKVEEAVQKILPMTQAFEAWMQANPSFKYSLPPTKPEPASPARVKYTPSMAIQSLTHGTSASAIARSPNSSDFNTDGPERWPDRFSHLTKDSYGNLRYTGGTSSFMLVDALTTLESTKASPEVLRKQTTADINLPFFAPGNRFRAQERLPKAEDMEYPPSEVADELVAIYFSRIHHTFPILHQQTFIERYTKAMEAYHAGQPSNEVAFVSLLFAVFACGACLRHGQLIKSKEKDGPMEFSGMEFYEKAQLLYWVAYGSATLDHVQTLALMSICNASWNTLAQSWINAGAAVRRAQDMGLHRVARRSPLTPFEKEIRRRVWWCVYGLDKVLSIALGRPSGTLDEDCNVEMPAELDDTQLLSSIEGNPVTPSEGSYMVGFVALLRISVIAGKVARFVSSTYIEDPKSDQILKTVQQLDGELNAWKEALPAAVRIDVNDTSKPKMTVVCLIAFFVYHSAIINLHRPFIPDYPDASKDVGSLGRCIGAARSCIQIGHLTRETLPTSHWLAYAVQYITLSGVLLLRSIAYITENAFVQSIIQDAEKCIKILESLEERWPASKRCREIVSDLLILVKTKLYGGTTAVQNLQAAQKAQIRGEQSDPQDGVPGAKGKRKRSPHPAPGQEHPSSRPRTERFRDTNNWQEITGASASNGHRSRKYSEGEPDDSARRHMQLSNLRTSMNDSPEGATPHPSQSAQNGHSGPLPPYGSRQAYPGQTYQEQPYPNYANTGTGYAPPQISLNLNMAPGASVEDLPFSGYDFLGSDVYATIDNTMKPPQHVGSQDYDEQSQFLWNAYNRPQEVPFPPASHGMPPSR